MSGTRSREGSVRDELEH